MGIGENQFIITYTQVLDFMISNFSEELQQFKQKSITIGTDSFSEEEIPLLDLCDKFIKTMISQFGKSKENILLYKGVIKFYLNEIQFSINQEDKSKSKSLNDYLETILCDKVSLHFVLHDKYGKEVAAHGKIDFNEFNKKHLDKLNEIFLKAYIRYIAKIRTFEIELNKTTETEKKFNEMMDYCSKSITEIFNSSHELYTLLNKTIIAQLNLCGVQFKYKEENIETSEFVNEVYDKRKKIKEIHAILEDPQRHCTIDGFENILRDFNNILSYEENKPIINKIIIDAFKELIDKVEKEKNNTLINHNLIATPERAKKARGKRTREEIVTWDGMCEEIISRLETQPLKEILAEDEILNDWFRKNYTIYKSSSLTTEQSNRFTTLIKAFSLDFSTQPTTTKRALEVTQSNKPDLVEKDKKRVARG